MEINAIKTDSFRQTAGSRPSQGEGSVLRQFCWYMVWPLVTVLLVVGVVYLDRMYTFREQTIHQENIRLDSLQLLFQDRNQSIVSDLKVLRNDQLLQLFLSDSGSLSADPVTELFRNFLSGKTFYSKIRLLGLSGKELIAETNGADRTGIAAQRLNALESSSVFEMLLKQQTDKIYLFFHPQKNSEKSTDDIRADSVQRFYSIVNDRNGKPAAFITLDYDRSKLFKSLSYTGQGQFRRIILIDRGTIRGLFNNPLQDGINSASAPSDGDTRSGEEKLSPGIYEDLIERAVYQPAGHIFHDRDLYVYKSITPLTSGVLDLHIDDSSAAHLHEKDEPKHWFLVSEVGHAYFAAQRQYSLKFLALLGVALLIPSFVACLFLAKSRARVKLESALRYREHTDHLEQLETKVQKRTRELDESNLKLSAEIAERLAAERLLRLNNELLSGIVGSIDGIVYAADFDSHEILFANEYLKQLFGFDPVGRLCWQFLHANQDGPCSFCTNCRLFDNAGKPTPPILWEYQNPYNKKWYAAKDQAILWSDGQYVRLEIAVDITEQKRLQYFLEEARKQAELAKGIRSRFVALVAHDLKSPFFSIIQMLKRILERETFTHQVHQQFLENIVKNGHRMLQMIDNLLSMDRFETGEMKVDMNFFDVSIMADEVLENFKHPGLQKDLALINEIPPGTELYADKYLYYVVLNNLVSNAVKFSERQGRVMLQVADRAQSATIVVADNGRGMSQEYARNLFKADVRTSSEGTLGEQGSGLGLIFCQEIMKAHHGEIHVESQRGLGTRFYVELPRCSNLESNRDNDFEQLNS